MEVWITGLGCICSAGSTLGQTWNTLLKGGGPRPGPPERLLKVAAKMGWGSLSSPAFTVGDHMFPHGFNHSAKDTLALAEGAAREALEQAGLLIADLAGSRTGIIIGSTAGNALHFLGDYADLKSGQPGLGQGIRDFFDSNPAEALAEKWDISGPVVTVGNACCSGTDAVGLGLEMISAGYCDRALVGGADALSLVPYVGFNRLMIYSDAPCLPFDKNRRGLNLGEGAGILLLESAQSVNKRGGQPLARLAGYGAASDAHHLTAPHPKATGLRQAIRRALGRADLGASKLAFVNAHGTATPENDRTESLAIKMELADPPVWAVKGATGHTLGAAGGIEAVLTVAALHYGQLPASPGFITPDPELGITPTTAASTIVGEAAMSVSLGFGGGNAAVVFRSLA